MGYAVVQRYGMTETASLISLSHPFRAAQGSIGRILPGREFRLAEDGEILVRGENVATGYWEKGAFRKGVTEGTSPQEERENGETPRIGGNRARDSPKRPTNPQQEQKALLSSHA